MTATAHALIGASIAAKIPDPLIGIPLAIISHIFADLIPHWDAATNHRKKSALRLKIEAALDVILGFSLSYLLFGNSVNPTYLFTMIIAAQLPDWIETPAFMFNIKVPPFSWAQWLGHNLQSRMQLPWGLATQVVTVGLLVATTLTSIGEINQIVANTLR